MSHKHHVGRTHVPRSRLTLVEYEREVRKACKYLGLHTGLRHENDRRLVLQGHHAGAKPITTALAIEKAHRHHERGSGSKPVRYARSRRPRYSTHRRTKTFGQVPLGGLFQLKDDPDNATLEKVGHRSYVVNTRGHVARGIRYTLDPHAPVKRGRQRGRKLRAKAHPYASAHRGRTRHSSHRGGRFVIGGSGLERPATAHVVSGHTYAMGASSSPSLIVVTSVDGDRIHYHARSGQHKGEGRVIERWIGEDLIARGERTFKQQYGVSAHAWVHMTEAEREAQWERSMGRESRHRSRGRRRR